MRLIIYMNPEVLKPGSSSGAKERERSPEVLEAHAFFTNSLKRFAEQKELEKLSVTELFGVYLNFINADASRQNYKGLLDRLGKKFNKKEAENNYRDYLFAKLPKELQERNVDASTKELEEVHKIRKEEYGLQLIAGFHVSPMNIPARGKISESHTPSTVFRKGGQTVELSGRRIEYSTNPHYLWNDPNPKRYLYLIEGSTGDTETDPDGLRSRNIKEKGGAEIIAKFDLTHDLEKTLDLKFRR